MVILDRRPTVGSDSLSPKTEVEPPTLERPALFDTGVWTWARDRRFPHLATWFNSQVRAGRVLVCDLVIVELLIGCAAETTGVPLVHYDRDYERLAKVSSLEHRWLLPDGALA